jgi:hypothetical protein
MAPEGPGAAGADLYGMGKVIYHAITGLPLAAFPELPDDLAMDSSPIAIMRLNRILMRACENKPTARYQTAAELLDDLRQLQPRLKSKP